MNWFQPGHHTFRVVDHPGTPPSCGWPGPGPRLPTPRLGSRSEAGTFDDVGCTTLTLAQFPREVGTIRLLAFNSTLINPASPFEITKASLGRDATSVDRCAFRGRGIVRRSGRAHSHERKFHYIGWFSQLGSFRRGFFAIALAIPQVTFLTVPAVCHGETNIFRKSTPDGNGSSHHPTAARSPGSSVANWLFIPTRIIVDP